MNHMAHIQTRSPQRSRRALVGQPKGRSTIKCDSPDQIFLFDNQGRYTRLSGKTTAAERVTEHLTTEFWKDWGVSTEQIELFNAQRDRVFRTGQSIVDEALHQTASYEYVLSPICDDEGVIHTVIATVRDTTDRKRSEQGLRFLAEASKILDSSLNTTTTLTNIAHLAVPYLADACTVHVLEADGSIKQIASVYADGISEQRGRDLREQYRYSATGTYGVPVVLRMGTAVLYRTITDEHMRIFTTDEEQLGRLRQIMPRSAMIVPLVARGVILGTLSFAISTSERHYSSADLAIAEDLAHRAALAVANARLYEDAQKAIRARDDFFSIASHELRSPLTVLQLQIDGMLRTAHNGGGPALAPDRLASKLETSKRQVQRFSRLLDDLLDISQIASGHLDLEIEDVDLGDIVRDVVLATEEQASLAGSKVHIHVESTALGRWDHARIEQIVINLVSNAVKYSNAKPIDVYVSADESAATLAVHDHGIGIASEDLGRIFDRFERAASSRGYEGMGLGLYIVNQIVEAFRGTIDVTSVPGQGSVFTVRLPLRPETTRALLSEYV